MGDIVGTNAETERRAASGAGSASQLLAITRRGCEGRLVPQSQTSPTGIYNEVDPMNFAIVAARFLSRLEAAPNWAGTEISWPPAAGYTHWRDLLCAHVAECRGEATGAEAILRNLPVAVLVPHRGFVNNK
jgi:hypothetical protein